MSSGLIPTTWQLPDAFLQRLGSTAGRQRLMQFEGQLLLVLHDVPDTGARTREGVLFWRSESGDWKSNKGEQGLVALDEMLDRYSARLEEFDKLENTAHQADQYSQLLEGLAPVVRSVRNLLDVLEEARKAMPIERRLIDPRDHAYELSRAAELLYDDSKNSMEVAVVKRAEEQSRASHKMLVTAHRLNVLAALFFPFATLGAVFGTTLTDNWRWSQTSLPFFLFILGCSVCGMFLALFISREEK